MIGSGGGGAYHGNSSQAYRLRGRFIRMPAQDRELLIRYTMQFQRGHLQRHYMA